jgi:anti-sigma factor RsiW
MNSDCPQRISVSQFVDNELTEQERVSLNEHLVTCTACKEELAELNRLRSSLACLTADPTVKVNILKSLPRDGQVARFTRQKLAVPLPIAAAILLLLGISVCGNAYLGLRQKANGQTDRKNIERAGLQSPAAPGAVAGGTGAPGDVSRPGRQITAVKPDISPAKSALQTAPSGSASAKSYVLALESEEGTVRFVTNTEYRLYPVPKIIVGSRVNSSEAR